MVDEYITPSGIIVKDFRRAGRDVPPWEDREPREWPSNPNIDPPPPPRTVGPNASEGFGNYHVMYPNDTVQQWRGPWRPNPYGIGSASTGMLPPVMPWSGWPVGWATPNWGDGSNGLMDIMGKISLVFGCIDLNSSLLATMPPYRLNSDDEILDSMPWMENPQPEVYNGWIEAMRQVVMSYWTGEAFIWATSRYADGSVRTWVMLNPGWVEVEMEGQQRRYWMGKPSEGAPEITDDVLHLRYCSWPGVPNGIGPLEALGNSLWGVEAMELYQSTLAARGGIPWGVLSAPGNMNEPQATEMRERFVRARLDSLGAPAVLSGGVTLTPFNLSPKDMALLELRQFDEARIATLLGVPPLLMALPSGENSLTYRNAEGIYDFHWRAYLRPKAAGLAQAISNWALPRGQRIELNRDEYVRPGLLDRARTYQTLFSIVDPETGERAMDIDEIRDIERFVTRADAEDDDDEFDDVSLDTLIKLGVPQEALWEKIGASPEDIAHWHDLIEDETNAQARAQASAYGAFYQEGQGQQQQPR